MASVIETIDLSEFSHLRNVPEAFRDKEFSLTISLNESALSSPLNALEGFVFASDNLKIDRLIDLNGSYLGDICVVRAVDEGDDAIRIDIQVSSSTDLRVSVSSADADLTGYDETYDCAAVPSILTVEACVLIVPLVICFVDGDAMSIRCDSVMIDSSTHERRLLNYRGSYIEYESGPSNLAMAVAQNLSVSAD